jgi:DNA-binding response OmpR family regulator
MSKVLLIEPDRVLARVFKTALETSGNRVSVMTSAQAAIFEADEFQPDLIILELQLVAHSGIEFLYELRSYPEWQSIPLIIHTIVPFNEFQRSWQLLQNELGVVSYLYKPQTTLAELKKQVQLYSAVTT